MVQEKQDSHMQKKKLYLDTDLTRFTKINSKWITDLNIKYRTMDLLYDLGENLEGLRNGSGFLDTKSRQNSCKKLISWTSLKLKTSAF